MSKEKKALSILILINIYWGLTTVLMKNVLYFMSPMMYIFLRFLTASITLVIIFRKQLGLISKKNVKSGIVLGLLTVIPLELSVFALNSISTTNSVFYSQLVIVFVPIILWIKYNQKPSAKYYLSLIVIIIGMLVFSGFSANTMSTGDIITIFSALLNSLAIIYTTNYVNADGDFSSLAIVQMVSSTFVAFPLIFLDEISVSVNSTSLMILILTGAIGSGIAFMGRNYAQRFVNTTTTSLVTILSPIFGVLGARIIPDSLGKVEEVSTSQIVGIVILCVGIFIYFTKTTRIKNVVSKIILRGGCHD